jgi:hypothetical protein
MGMGKSLIAGFLSALLCNPLAIAQDRKADPQSSGAISQEVTIIIQKEQIKFTAQRDLQSMQLQVMDQTGEIVYDSGVVAAGEINWSIQNGGGDALKSGLYAYTITIQESDSQPARVRRGSFIVDRARDRDERLDKIWVTSQREDGVGAEITVARNDALNIVGTSSERTDGGVRAMPKRETENKVEASPTEKTAQALMAAANGTIGRIAKFTTATDLGNSLIAETNGNIGIATSAPVSRLQVVGNAATPGTAIFQADPSKGPNASHIHWGATGDVYFRSAASSGRVILQDTGGSVGIGTNDPFGNLEIAGYSPLITLRETQQGKNQPSYIQNSGGSLVFKPLGSGYATAAMVMQANTLNVGIGSTNPTAKLEVASGSGDIFHLIGYEPFMTLYDSNHGYARSAIQQVGGGMNFFTDSYLQNQNPFAYFRLDNNGNLGVGTATPQAKLDVAGETRTRSLQIVGGSDFAENFDVNAAPSSGVDAIKAEPGFVVSIDPNDPGKLTLSSRAYDRRVAGVLSGAGGVNPGMMMGQTGTLADGKYPVALSGRVYVYVDASQGAIEPGDMLTTSTIPGHAMKATDWAKAQGAILGKAMTGLKTGKGLVLVLVTLQ